MAGMEPKASFRECPKCGLRNKQAAVQCDFCGQSLTNDDDWQSHVKDLESLTRVDLRKPMDDKVSRRIESTIIRKETPYHKGIEIKEVGSLEEILRDFDQPQPQKEVRAEETDQPPTGEGVTEPTEIAPHESSSDDSIASIEMDSDVGDEADNEGDVPDELSVIEAILDEVKVATVDTSPPSDADAKGPIEPEAIGPERSSELDKDDRPRIEATIEEAEVVQSIESPAPTIKLKLVQVVKEIEGPEADDHPVVPLGPSPRFVLSGAMARPILVLGAALYLIVVGLTAMGTLDIAPGLGGGALASLFVIYGVAISYRSFKDKDGDEVYICPKCHETVDKRKENCPACGASFRSED